jgi:predicted RNA-binding Zn ribbon-like protein
VSSTTLSNGPLVADHVHRDVPLETSFDFLNTLDLENGALVERLISLETAAAWFVEHAVVDEATAITDLATSDETRDALLARIVTTRTALSDVAHAVATDHAPSSRAIDEVNRALRSRERVELVADDDGLRLGHSHVGDAVDDALARIAEPIVREIGYGHERRFRICASDTCRWIFYDESRSGLRRWCDMATCGNRAKARRHRARVKMLDLDLDVAPADAARG